MYTLALVMITKNEERCLEKSLRLAKDLVDEIYITDTGSTDRTLEIAASFGAHISHYSWTNDFAAARNFSLAQSPCSWNLVLDADEYLESGLRKDLEPFLTDPKQIGAIQRKDLYVEDQTEEGPQYGMAFTYAARLLPKGVGFTGRIHEQVDASLPIRPLPLIFQHDGYLQPGKGERNLEILYRELKEHPDEPYFLFQTAQTLRNLKDYPKACAYYERFYQHVPLSGAGYRPEGVITYLYSLLEIKDFGRAYEIILAEKDRLANYADYHFVCGVFYMQAILADTPKYVHLLPQIEASYLRCLEIGEIPLHQGVEGCGSYKAAYNLGTWYEVSGNQKLALDYYRMAQKAGYRPAIKRLRELQAL